MKQTVLSLILYLLILSGILQAKNTEKPVTGLTSNRVFELNKPDYRQSPFTGMTRQHWKDASLYILQGAFSYIRTLDDPMKFPKQPGKSYPRNAGQNPTEKLEGLCRTLFYATPLLKDNPNLVINHIRVADYYRVQMCNLIDPNSLSYIKPRSKNGGPSQNLVEFGALSISLLAIPEVLWNPLSKAQKDGLAQLMISYGDGPTVASNWKFFNIFVLSFYQSRGYAINEVLLKEYLQKTLEHYRGDGWYNDNPAYDYYSMWAFQMYGMVWSEYFGKKYYPSFAQKFLVNFSEVKDSYPYMFSRKGEMIMWGRSISYRYASIAPFPLMGFENDSKTNFGWMRRIASGTILQFLQNPDFMKDSIPTLGFYGPFEPAVQSYSCRGSVFWSGKAFLGLLVPENNPFWTATENEGPWEKGMQKGTVINKFQKGPGILITDYPNIGASEIRAWCHVKSIGAGEAFRSSENYNRLSYNSAFPWQADGANGEVAMNYVFKNKENKWEPLRLFTFKKFEGDVYYRNAVLETNKNVRLQLADFPMPNGILRVDKVESTDTVDLRLGHYALPEINGKIRQEIRKMKGHEVRILSNGIYQLAMVSVIGWEKMETIHTTGLHPMSKNSAVMNVTDHFLPGKNKQKIYCTLMTWKKAGEHWTNDELIPVVKVIYSENENSVKVIFTDKTTKIIHFDDPVKL
jgi:hypothetical protein